MSDKNSGLESEREESSVNTVLSFFARELKETGGRYWLIPKNIFLQSPTNWLKLGTRSKAGPSS